MYNPYEYVAPKEQQPKRQLVGIGPEDILFVVMFATVFLVIVGMAVADLCVRYL